MGWSEKADASLRKHLREGLTFAEVAIAINAECGTDISRNACIGRARRLAIPCKSSHERQVRNQIDGMPQVARAVASPLKKTASQAIAEVKLKDAKPKDRRAAAAKIRGVTTPGTPAWAPKIGAEAIDISGGDPAESQAARSLLDLAHDDCKWPSGGVHVGDPILFCCSHARLKGFPYCEEHLRAATNTHGNIGQARAEIKFHGLKALASSRVVLRSSMDTEEWTQ